MDFFDLFNNYIEYKSSECLRRGHPEGGVGLRPSRRSTARFWRNFHFAIVRQDIRQMQFTQVCE